MQDMAAAGLEARARQNNGAVICFGGAFNLRPDVVLASGTEAVVESTGSASPKGAQHNITAA